MDNVTHGLAGLLVADAASHWLERQGITLDTRARRVLSVLGVVAAEFPDSDLIYSGPVLHMGSLGYLLHHRGHTHTIVWAMVSAVLLWMGARIAVGRRNRGKLNDGRWNYALLSVAMVGTLSHLLLDFTNSYGVHPFWPFDGRWYYGDAVFIVEPWLWLVAIPPLFWNRPTRTGRVVLALCYALILAAVLLLGQVARDVAMVLVIFAASWPLLHRVLSVPRRTLVGVSTWLLVTVGFFVVSTQARAAVVQAVRGGTSVTGSAVLSAGDERMLDVVLNPGPGDFGCWSALVITASDTSYRVTSAFVAPLAAVRPLANCVAGYRTGRLGSDVLGTLPSRAAPPFVGTARVQWRSSWSASRGALAELARTRCEVHAALFFMRAPVWQRFSDSTLLLSDARFGVGGGGFSELTVPAGAGCSLERAWVPGWVPPRLDLLSSAARGN